MISYRIYTDGSCVGNPGPGGYAAVICRKKEDKIVKRIIKGYIPYTTNNRIELMAVIKSLEEVRHNSQVTIYTDSQYIETAINSGTINEWMVNGWKRTKLGTDIINRDLWQLLIEINSEKNLLVSYVKIKGHSRYFYNNLADKIAKGQAKKYLP